MRHRHDLRAAGLRASAMTLVLVAALVTGAAPGRAGEIVPSVGLTKAVNGGGEATAQVGLAFRGDLAPFLMSELGVTYRSESRFNDQLKLRMWPVTASLYLKPLPALYAGGGVGWYHTTYDYAPGVPIADQTKQEYGVHLGGGLKVPLGAGAGLDLGGRYVMMRDQNSRLIPQRFDPDFWVTSIGLAFKF